MTAATDMGFDMGKLCRVNYVSGSIGESIRHSPEQRIAIPLEHLVPVETPKTYEASTNKPLLLLYIQQQYPNDKVLKALVESL